MMINFVGLEFTDAKLLLRSTCPVCTTAAKMTPWISTPIALMWRKRL